MLTHQRHLLTRKRLAVATLLLLLVATTSFGLYRYTRPIDLPVVQHTFSIEQTTSSPDIPWPAAQASLGTVEHGLLASKPNQSALPTASTAKLITVLTVLNKKPLALGEQGPTLTIDQQDVASYRTHSAIGGSVVAVQLGEQLTQYQMLQGILIRSGNNLADSLAIWTFGSLSEYRRAAQAYVDELGMTNTTVGTDASGLSTTTTSTAEDLTRLGIAAMKNDIVREIVRQPSSSLPVDGVKPNTNWMLGQNGVVGIKTGNLPAIGGVFVIASEYTVESEAPITIVGTVQGTPTTYDAIAQAGQLAEAIKPLFVHTTIIKKGAVIATITTPWGEKSDVVAENDIITFGWKYAAVQMPTVVINSDVPFKKGASLGTISIGSSTTQLIAADTIQQPSWQWRLTTTR